MTQKNRCLIVYSGGTDSTCVAALKAEEFKDIHLVTYYELGTQNTPMPKTNIERLRERFPEAQFTHNSFSTDKIIRYFYHHHFWKNLIKYRFLNLATCGLSSMSWHIRSIVYCKENKIEHVYDGLTRELMHFPGHMDFFIGEMKALYAHFGIVYENPVRDWDVPVDQQFIDRLIVDQHGFVLPSEEEANELKKTTGEYLFKKGVFPHPNVKGSDFDRKMQHDCYPFVLYNMMVFWIYLVFMNYTTFCEKVQRFLQPKINHASEILSDYLEKGDESPFSTLMEKH